MKIIEIIPEIWIWSVYCQVPVWVCFIKPTVFICSLLSQNLKCSSHL